MKRDWPNRKESVLKDRSVTTSCCAEARLGTNDTHPVRKKVSQIENNKWESLGVWIRYNGEIRKGVTESETAEAVYFLPRSLAGWILAASSDWPGRHRMTGETRSGSGCRVGDLTRTEGRSTWFIEVVGVWRTRASRGAAGRVGDGAIKLAVIGAVTEEAKRFSLTQERDGWVHSSKSTGPNSGTDVGGETARRRNCSS